MKINLLTRLVAVMAASLLLAGAARTLFAQEQSQQQTPPQSQAQQPQAAQSEKSQQELKVSDQQAQRQVTDANKASKLIGMQVKNKQDEDLGKVKDLVVDLKSGKIAYAVLSSGATFGIGGKMVAVPIESLTLQPGQKALLIDLPKQQLSQAPGFNEQNWPDLDAAQKGQTIGLSSSAQGGTGSGSQQSSGSGTNQQQQQPQQSQPQPQPTQE